jgi:hypothetical protein
LALTAPTPSARESAATRFGPIVLAAFGGALALAGVLFDWSDSSASNKAPTAVGPAGTAPVADFKAQSIAVSYRDTATPTSNPITEAGVGEDFRVRVDFGIHNNGPSDAEATFRFELLGPPPGCEFRQPADGIDEFESGSTVPMSVSGFGAFAELKVRCTTPGPKTWSALVTVGQKTGTDPNDMNNEASASSADPIDIVGGTVEDTPTPTVTPTPTPGSSGGGPSGGSGGPPSFIGFPTPTPTPTPTFFSSPPPTPVQDPFFSLRADNPSGLDPADILRIPAVPVITCLQLGLDCDGVDGQGPPVQDDLDALTFGNEAEADQIVFFSTDSDSVGIDGSGTDGQSNPALQCQEEGNEYYEFPVGVGGDNRVFFSAELTLFLAVTACPDQPNDDDDMDALAWGTAIPDPDIYFSLAPSSPTLATLGASPADILVTRIGETPVIYRSAASLGLRAGDNIDGLCLYRNENKDVFLLSLGRGSPTLAAIGASPDDLLYAGGPDYRPSIFNNGSQYGLLSTDNLDAVKCQEPKPPRLPHGDLNCDGVIDMQDVYRLLLFLAGLPIDDIVNCPDIGSGPADALVGDLNCDGQVNNADLVPLLLRVARARVPLPAGCPPIGVPV